VNEKLRQGREVQIRCQGSSKSSEQVEKFRQGREKFTSGRESSDKVGKFRQGRKVQIR
jgi:hypothetical protein